MRGPVVAVLAVGLTLSALTACSSTSGADDAPAAASSPATPSRLPSSAASPSPTESSPQPPAFPAAAKEHTQLGAEAFVRFYLDAVQYGFMTGDTSVFLNYSQQTCASCQSEKNQIENQYATGGYFRGGQVTITDIEAAPVDVSGSVVDVLFHQAQTELVDSNGHVQKTSSASDVPLIEFYAGWDSDRWSLYEFKFGPS